MKKVMITLLASASVLSLVACAPKRYERQSKPKTTTSSTVKKEKKDTGQKYYQAVLERYKAYATAITVKDQTALQNELKKIDATSEEYAYVFNLQTLGSTNEWHYAFWDLNQDGSDELLIGDGKTIAAVYYLKDKQPTLLHVAYVASAGGYRSSLEAYDNGQLAYASWQSTQPEMELILYSLEKEEAKEEKKATIQIGGKGTVEQELGISAKKLDLTKLDWKKIASEDKTQTTAKSEEKKSGSFQVQVSVVDLRIRQAPSTSAPSAGMIEKGIHTITETVEADGYTWGKLQSGQGWIALEFTTRVEGSNTATSNKGSGGMNIQEIQNGDFSSIAGTWRNGLGWTLEFDRDGLTGNQFFTDGSGVVNNINPDHSYITGAIHSSKPNTAGGAAISFLPAGTSIKPDSNQNSDPSDTKKDRIWTGQQYIWNPEDFFYRVD